MSTDVLPRDEFSTRLRTLQSNPAAIRSSSTIQIADDYGNTSTWIVDGFRYDGRDELLLQRIGADEKAIRLVLPPRVMAAIIGQRDRAKQSDAPARRPEGPRHETRTRDRSRRRNPRPRRPSQGRPLVKSITDATWKDAAVIEVRSLLARLEGIAGRASSTSTPPANLVKPTELESVARQAAKLADMIDRIEEKPKPKRRRPRRVVHGTAKIARITIERAK